MVFAGVLVGAHASVGWLIQVCLLIGSNVGSWMFTGVLVG